MGGGWMSYGWVEGWRMEELWVGRWVEDGGVMGGLVGGGWRSYEWVGGWRVEEL